LYVAYLGTKIDVNSWEEGEYVLGCKMVRCTNTRFRPGPSFTKFTQRLLLK
jgi:hypothetical protein